MSFAGIFFAAAAAAQSAPVVLDTNLQIRLIMNTTNSSGGNSIRIAKDPRNNQLYYSRMNGDIFQVNLQPGSGSTSTRVYTSANHGISGSAQGMAIGPDGTIYIAGNMNTNSNNNTFARIMKGVPAAAAPGPGLCSPQPSHTRSATTFDHVCNGIIVSPDSQYVYLNSGARTDHGEVQSKGGVFPNTREVALTAKILRLPASGSNLVLTNDINALQQAGYVFAEGIRNTFDFAFAANGDLFGTENGPDRDMSEELNWLRPGLHFGFPWRIGGADNPQQFPTYDPSTDKLLDSRFIAVSSGYYHNDPTFPPPPTTFAEPVISPAPTRTVIAIRRMVW